MSPKAFEFNFNAEAQAFYQKARDIYVAYDPEKAKALLAEAGYAGEDIRIDYGGDPNKETMDTLEIAKKNWEDVGLKVVVNALTGTVFEQTWYGGKGSIHTAWEVGDGPDHLLYPSWVVPNEHERWAPLRGVMFQMRGTTSEMTEAEKSPWDRQPPRYNKNDPEYVGTPVEKLHNLFDKAMVEPDEVKRAALVWDMWKIHEDEGPFFIGTVANYPRITIKSKKLMNYPSKEQLKMGGFVNPWIIPYPAVTNPETWSYK
jgi:peptide/nickel transport system substrate-binding protein